MELLKKGPTFWLVIKIKVLKLKLKSISDAPPTRSYINFLMYSRCYFVMKRFNSFPPLPASEQAGLQPGAGFPPSNQRLGRDLLPQSQMGRISAGFIHFFLCRLFTFQNRNLVI